MALIDPKLSLARIEGCTEPPAPEPVLALAGEFDLRGKSKLRAVACSRFAIIAVVLIVFIIVAGRVLIEYGRAACERAAAPPPTGIVHSRSTGCGHVTTDASNKPGRRYATLDRAPSLVVSPEVAPVAGRQVGGGPEAAAGQGETSPTRRSIRQQPGFGTPA